MITVRFYTSFYEVFESKIYKYIWVPNTSDFLTYYNYIKKYSDSRVEVEERLLVYTEKEEDYVTFKLDRSREEQKRKKIFLYAQSDTLADSCSLIFESLKEEHDCFLIYPFYNDEGAEYFFKENGYESQQFTSKTLKKENPDVLILLNDWAKEAKRVMSYCNLAEIPTVCIQESIIDFGDHFKRMTYSDYVFVQGIQTVLDLGRDHYFLTGNPRYNLKLDNIPPIVLGKALINCNFTYGIYEDIRDVWIKDIALVLEEQKIGYKISQHPRDKGELIEYQDRVIKSNSESISSQISEVDIVFTRFSSLIHEGILQKKYVIYYNPHNEEMKYDFKFNGEFLFLCETPKDIEIALSLIRAKVCEDVNEQMTSYCVEHCLPQGNSPTQNIKSIVNNHVFKTKTNLFKSYSTIILFQPPLLKLIRVIKSWIKL